MRGRGRGRGGASNLFGSDRVHKLAYTELLASYEQRKTGVGEYPVQTLP